MGTNFEKKVSASDQSWKINSKKSMNKMVSDYVCNKQSINNIYKFKLPNCNTNFNPINWNNCFGKFKNQNGDVYVGDFKRGQYHGNGLVQREIFLVRFIQVNGFMAKEMAWV